MKLKEQDAQPLYKQLVQAIQEGIQAGEYPEGSRLPSEQELSSLYQVSRITVRAALKELAADELVVRKQGKGTFVGRKKLKRNLSLATSFSKACREMGRVPGARMLFSGLEPATEADRAALKLPEGGQVVCLRRLRFADGVPISVEEDRFPPRYEFLLQEDLTDRSLLELLERKYDITFFNVHRTIELVYAPHPISKYLNCTGNTPLLYIVSEGLEARTELPGQRSLQYILGENFKLYI